MASVCEMCASSDTGTVATYRCVECDQLCCELCTQSHARIKATRSHLIINVGQQTSAPEKMCPTHQDEKLRFYCTVCKLVICRDCKLTQHEGHATPDISQVSSSAKQVLQDVMPLLYADLQSNLKTILQEASQHKSEVLQKKKQIASTLHQRADLLKAEIDTCVATVEKNLFLEAGDVELAIDTILKEMTQKLATLDDLVTRGKCVLEGGGQAELLQVPKQIGEFVGAGQTSTGIPTTGTSFGFGSKPSAFSLSVPFSNSNLLKVFTDNGWCVDLKLTNQSSQPLFGFGTTNQSSQSIFGLRTTVAPHVRDNVSDQPFTIPDPLKAQIASCLGTVGKVSPSPPVLNRQAANVFHPANNRRYKSRCDGVVEEVVKTVTEIQGKLNGWV